MASISKSFTVTVKFRKLSGSCENATATAPPAGKNGLFGEPCTFKVDGQRFEMSSRTIKFHCDTKYSVHITVNPPVQFELLGIGGVECPLRVCDSSSPSSISPAASHDTDRKTAGQYWAEWKTDGISSTQAGKREAINFSLRGPEGTLCKKLQCKFYSKADSHAAWGNALDAIVYKCTNDSQGSLIVVDEEFR